MSPEYCISHKRELNKTEIELIEFLLTDSGFSELLPSVKHLKVVARCGCGVCPTVLLGTSLTSEAILNASDITRYIGTMSNGTKVGVALMAQDSQLSELEAWSVCGGEFNTWPEIGTLECINT
jgi:hypothetical protein